MDTEHTQDLTGEGLQQFRIERGAQALGTDGPLGTVQQVVVDRETGELQSLVVRGEAGMDYELPADSVETATGDEVRLSIGRKDLAARPSLAQPYNPDLYSEVETGQVVPPGEAAEMAQDSPVLTNIESDAVDVMAPASGPDSGASAGPDSLGGTRDAATLAEEPDEMTDVEAVIIPGSVPGEADVFIAGPASMAGAGEMAPTAGDMWTPTRGPQGADERGPGGRAVMSALGGVGVLLLTAGAIATYLVLRRNQQRATLSARAQRQASAAAARATALRDTVRAQGSARWADLSARAREQQRLLRIRANDWLPIAAASLAALWGRTRARGNLLGQTMRLRARQTASATSDTLAATPSARQVGSRMSDRTNLLGNRLADMAGQLQQQVRPGDNWRQLRGQMRTRAAWRRMRRAPERSAGALRQLTDRAARTNADTVKAAKQAAAKAGKQAQQARDTARRGVRRARRRARWFRNGIVAGAVGGILYAPKPGRETRATLSTTLRRIPGMDTLIGPSSTMSGTGPRPESPGARATWRGGETTPSNLGTMSEQPGTMPLATDLTPDDLGGPAI